MTGAEARALQTSAREAQKVVQQAHDPRVPVGVDAHTLEVLALIEVATAPLVARIAALEGRAASARA